MQLQIKASTTAILRGLLCASLTLVVGCAANQTTPTGYLDGYADLVAAPDNKAAVYQLPGLVPTDFSALAVDMVEFAGHSARVAGLTDEERTALKSHLMQSLARALKPPTDGSLDRASRRAKVRAAITDFDAPNTAMNVVMAVVLVPLSTGGASMEFEVRDEASGQRLLAMTCSDSGSVTSWQGMKDAFGRLDHAKSVLDACANRLAVAWYGTLVVPSMVPAS